MFFAIHMLVQNPIGLLLAALLSSQFIRGRAIFRTLIFTPTVLSVVLVGFIWRMILSPLWGISSDFLDLFGLAEYQALAGPGGHRAAHPLADLGVAVGRHPDDALPGGADQHPRRTDRGGARGWRDGLGRLLADQVPADSAHRRHCGRADLRGQLQRLRPDLHHPGRLAGPNFSTDILGTFFYRTFFGVQLQPGNPTMGATIAGVMFLIILTGVLIYMFGWQRRMLQVEF